MVYMPDEQSKRAMRKDLRMRRSRVGLVVMLAHASAVATLGTIAAVMFCSTALCQTIVVDGQAPNASDKNDGKEGSPLKTIQAGANLAQPGDTVLVKAGVYRECVVPPRGGTSREKPIIYKAAPGEPVSIRASEQITSWVKQDADVWLVELDNAFFGDFNPYALQVKGSWLRFHNNNHLGEVYLDGEAFLEKQQLEDVQKTPNTWCANVEDSRTRIWANFGKADPNKALSEIHVRECVLFPELEGLKHITIDGFEIKHAAANWAPPNQFQKGAIGPRFGYGWVVQNCTVSDVKNVGICIGAVQDHHWDDRKLPPIETFGHHILRNNTIRKCGQAGIVGAYGCVRCVIEGNFIEDIAYQQQYGGAEVGGIKLHFPIDAIIRNNHIRGVRTKPGGPGGIWLDWGAQNARISGNIVYDCDAHPLKLEVNHGPIMVDNNIFIGSQALCWGDGTLFVHNLFYRTEVRHKKDGRRIPWYEPHSTVEAGRDRIQFRDDRFINNIFIGGSGLQHTPAGAGYLVDHNVYLDGARKHGKQDGSSIVDKSPSDIQFKSETSGATLKFNLGKAVLDSKYPQITSKLLGKLEVSKMNIETPDGKPLDITTDYFGNPIEASRVLPGPFQSIKAGRNTFGLWPKK